MRRVTLSPPPCLSPDSPLHRYASSRRRPIAAPRYPAPRGEGEGSGGQYLPAEIRLAMTVILNGRSEVKNLASGQDSFDCAQDRSWPKFTLS